MQNLCFKPANILLPEKEDHKKWSVVACDQYTSQPKYWESVENEVADANSTLRLVFPEIYLNDNDEERIKNINANMEKYLSEGVFKEYKDALIYLERTTGENKTRCGILGVVDLDSYEYKSGTDAKIRATEGTVIERIPPRVKIRENAPLELPHIMLLYNDAEDKVMKAVDKGEKVYDFDLMKNGGHLSGWLVADNSAVLKALEILDGENDMLFAVGDGNHSLATAKTCWENIKSSGEYREDHPARYALVEIVNIHDSALFFEPIHRIVTKVDTEKLVKAFYDTYEIGEEGQKVTFVVKGEKKDLYIKNPDNELAVGTVQSFLDKYLRENEGEIDYIHGEDVVLELSMEENSLGILLPAIDKSEFFAGIEKDGSLPRKTFSMGEAFEKRYYFEARKIK